MDLRVDREWLMLYSSFVKGAATGFLWNYARGRSLPVVAGIRERAERAAVR